MRSRDDVFVKDMRRSLLPLLRWHRLRSTIQKLFGSFKGDAFSESVALFYGRRFSGSFDGGGNG